MTEELQIWIVSTFGFSADTVEFLFLPVEYALAFSFLWAIGVVYQYANKESLWERLLKNEFILWIYIFGLVMTAIAVLLYVTFLLQIIFNFRNVNEIFTYENIITYQLIWILVIWFTWRVLKKYLLPKTTPDESIKISYFEEKAIESVALNLHNFLDADFIFKGKHTQDGTYKAKFKGIMGQYYEGPFYDTEYRIYNYSSPFREKIELIIKKYYIPKEAKRISFSTYFPPDDCEVDQKFYINSWAEEDFLGKSFLEISSNKRGKKQRAMGMGFKPVSRFIQIETHIPEGQIEQPTEECKENISNALKEVLLELFTFREDDKVIRQNYGDSWIKISKPQDNK